MVKQNNKIDITKSIKGQLDILESNLEKIVFLEDYKNKCRKELRKKKYNKISEFYVPKNTPLESKERLLSIKHSILLQRVKWTTNQIAVLKRKEKLLQIEWLGKEEQLHEFIRSLITHQYLDSKMEKPFSNIFFISKKDKNAKRISHTIEWKKSIISLIYFIVQLSFEAKSANRLIGFTKNWTWIESTFTKKNKNVKNCLVQFEKTDFEKMRGKKQLDVIIKRIYNV